MTKESNVAYWAQSRRVEGEPGCPLSKGKADIAKSMGVPDP
jgi:hypothetical protein